MLLAQVHLLRVQQTRVTTWEHPLTRTSQASQSKVASNRPMCMKHLAERHS